jgi:hypothetical protein
MEMTSARPLTLRNGDPGAGDESEDSGSEEHMRQAENADAEAAGQPPEGAGDGRGAHEDG